MPKIEIARIPAQPIASYPKEFAPVISGREKQKIGDAAGLTQFGVNITRIKPGSASALRHWHEQEDEWQVMPRASAPAAALRIASSIAPRTMRFISKLARVPKARGCITPTSIS
jgi:hypothetical protein